MRRINYLEVISTPMARGSHKKTWIKTFRNDLLSFNLIIRLLWIRLNKNARLMQQTSLTRSTLDDDYDSSEMIVVKLMFELHKKKKKVKKDKTKRERKKDESCGFSVWVTYSDIYITCG